MGERLDAVLEAIYAAYTKGWNDPANVQNNLASEAIWLGHLIVELLPREAEALGLLGADAVPAIAARRTPGLERRICSIERSGSVALG